ncbi:MAG TPA: class I SAM-dependent methyltransferase [Kiritimatiellia bacterium]|nr:class I SAM-dependent methyltransferase [Kiritimatiellia bacterium]HSA17332.1 class I SAM-dependent methyltransferase [Kiritimatiellia bacterium]
MTQGDIQLTECCLCAQSAVRELADFGPQPICNRYLPRPDGPEFMHPMALGQCGACGLVQLLRPVPAEEIVPPYDWIVYNEPEGHLDRLADILSGLPGLLKRGVIAGVSYKDDTLLRRLRERGHRYTWRLDAHRDLDMESTGASVELLQGRISPEGATHITHGRGRSDMVIGRQVLEHSHRMRDFLEGLKRLLYPGGFVVVEVPDCTRAVENGDAAILWEEHIVYFTPQTFRWNLAIAGFKLVHYECFPYPFENSLVAVVQADAAASEGAFPPASSLEPEFDRARRFVRGIEEQRRKARALFARYRAGGGRVALFGAGHLACTYINILGLADVIDFVVDDHPKKKGLFMPGSRLPIRGSEALLTENVKLCLLSLSPEAEDKVIGRNQAFLARGGVFSSINPSSKHALKL